MRWLGVAALLVAAGCGKKPDGFVRTAAITVEPTVDKAAPAPAMSERPAPPPPADQPTLRAIVHSIAYSYSFRYETPAARLADVERAHQALCDRLGPTRCQMIGATLQGRAGAYSRGMLHLRVAPGLARDFGMELGKAVAQADGSLLESNVTGEDLTRQVIDAEAALKAKRTLRDRLQTLLETRSGKLEDLLEVEKALSQTQQELDTATSELAALRTRLDLSTVDIAYKSTLPPPGEEQRPIARAIGSLKETFGTSVGLLITTLAAVLPFAVVFGGLIALWRAVRRRRRSRV